MNFILVAMLPWLSHFRWYRKKMGGTWYKVYDVDESGGFTAPIDVWTQFPIQDKILETEIY